MTASITAAPLIPPFRFGIVQDGLYRGAYPKDRNLRFLRLLQLRTIISLIPDPPGEHLEAWCRKHSIRIYHIKVERVVDDNVPLTSIIASTVVQYLMVPNLQPIYVHCLDGADVTGLVVACLRRVQLWSRTAILSELSRCLMRTSGVISSDQSSFIDRFSSFGPSATVKEVKIPSTVPAWLWPTIYNGKDIVTPQPPFRHPTLKLVFAEEEQSRAPSAAPSRASSQRNSMVLENFEERKAFRFDMRQEALRNESTDESTGDDSHIEDYSGDEMSMSLTLKALALEGT